MGSLPGWIPKHVVLWEALHGVIPNGRVLKCIDGDRTNTDPSNWESVPYGVVGRLSKHGFRDAPAELKPTIMAVAKLEHALSEGKATMKRTDRRQGDWLHD
jgi:hypothetical protein